MTDTPQKKTYRVTDPNAVFVAGSRVAEDRTVELFPEQARYSELAGAIELVKGGKAKADKPAASEG